jgi:hypothetical protein
MTRPIAGLLPFLALAACQESETKVLSINSAPVSDAGSAISQSADTPVILDGGGSYDPDGDSIAYHWSFKATPESSGLSESEDVFPGNGTTTATTTFQADETGTYVVTLMVEDENGAWSDPSHVVVTIGDGQAAVADAGADVEAIEGETIGLDGSGSYDPMGRDLSYYWAFQAVPSSSGLTSLAGFDSMSPSFETDVGGVYIISLVVDNGVAQSSPDTLVARVSTADPQAPVALAGDDQEVEDCLAITLDGSGSYDANGDELTYQWSIQDQPADSTANNDSFEDRTAASTTFFADAAGDYTFSLAVFDGTDWSGPDIVKLTASERSYNSDPIVDAGNPKNSDGGEAECSEDGYTYDCESCASMVIDLGDDASVTDADGDPLTYAWAVVSGEAEITDSSALVTSVTVSDAEPTEPEACEDNEYEFQLSVTDCTGENETDTVVYTVSCCGVAASR